MAPKSRSFPPSAEDEDDVGAQKRSVILSGGNDPHARIISGVEGSLLLSRTIGVVGSYHLVVRAWGKHSVAGHFLEGRDPSTAHDGSLRSPSYSAQDDKLIMRPEAKVSQARRMRKITRCGPAITPSGPILCALPPQTPAPAR